MDFLSLQVEIPTDDAEFELKNGLMQLHNLPFCGLFCTGAEIIPWNFLASLFVSTHPSLDRFIASGTQRGANSPSAAAEAAGEKVWGPAYTFAALENDATAVHNIQEVIAGVLQSVADAAQGRKRKIVDLRRPAAQGAKVLMAAFSLTP